MKTSQEIQAEIRRLEQEASDLRRAEQEKGRRARQERRDDFIKNEGIHTGCSDDYWTLTVGKYADIYKEGIPAYEFYFGYEEPWCPLHGARCPEDCDESEWGFTASIRGQRVMHLGSSSLLPDYSHDDGAELLLAGIGMFIRDHMTPNQ